MIELLSEWHPLWNIKTDIEARKYIDELYDTLNLRERESIIKIFFKVSNASLKRFKRTGYAGGSSDETVYKLLEIADTCHDFFDHDYSDEYVRNYIKEQGYILPDTMDIPTLRNERKFIEYLSSNEGLLYGDKSTNNPLYKAKLFKITDIDTDAFTDLEELWKQNITRSSSTIANKWSHICGVDTYVVFDPNKRPKPYIELKQVAYICHLLREWIGDKRTFQVDLYDDHLMVLMLAQQLIHNEFIKKFRTEAENGRVKEVLLDYIQRHRDIKALKWDIKVTDANLFDSANNKTKLEYDKRPTGDIFKNNPYQISLNGIVCPGMVDFSIKEQHGETTRARLTSGTCSKLFSVNSLAAIIPFTSVQSETKSGKVITEYLDIRKVITGFSSNLKYALKRAGDWAQVENCVKYNKVFVTGDKLASLYAYFRKVPFIYIHKEKHQFRDVEFLQCSFVICRSQSVAS
jgi:hypothetical protein